MNSFSRLVNNPISVGMEEILLFASKMYCNKKYEDATFQKWQISFYRWEVIIIYVLKSRLVKFFISPISVGIDAILLYPEKILFVTEM